MPPLPPPPADSLRCPACNYAIGDLERRVQTCPECGKPITWADPRLVPLAPRPFPWALVATAIQFAAIVGLHAARSRVTSTNVLWILSSATTILYLTLIITTILFIQGFSVTESDGTASFFLGAIAGIILTIGAITLGVWL